MDHPWWRGATIYQIYPRSFADANGDGIGDLAGIRDHLGHVADLGVDAVWLSPFYRSPMADLGYDVSDHCDVDPVYGTLADAEALIDEAHDLGLRVVLDYVANHTSDQHRWFQASRSSPADPHRGWYVWRDRGPGGAPPNNWRAMFTGEQRWARDADGQLRPVSNQPPPPGVDPSAWTWDDQAGQLYLHTFLPQQPDLDWRHPAVVTAMHDVARFWLDRGVDGFRLDAIKAVGKPVGLPDAPAGQAAIPEAGLTDAALVAEVVGGLRRVADRYGDQLLIGEVHHPSVPEIMRFVAPDLLTSAFVFPPMLDRWAADAWRRHIDDTEGFLASPAAPATAAWPTWVLSNHDVPRHADRFGSEARARAAAVLLLTLRGTACLYAGEELGLVDADVPADRRVDPGGRDGCRAPVPWTPDPRHGWAGPGGPWLPFPGNAGDHDVATEAADPDSVLALYRRLLALRRARPALRDGRFTWLGGAELGTPLPDDVLGWRRGAVAGAGDGGADVAVVLVSFSSGARAVELREPWSVAADSRRPSRHGHRFDGRLAADQALVLVPSPAPPSR